MKPLHLLILISTTSHVVFAGAKLCVLLSAVHMGASPLVVGLLIALFSAPVVFTSVAMGRLVDRRGARRPMLAAALFMAIGAFCAYAWHGIGSLFAVSLIMGMCYNAFTVGSQQQIGRHGTAAERVGNFSLSMQAYSVANFVAPLMTGFAIDGMGYANAFLLLAVLPLLPVAVLALNMLRMVPAPSVAGAAPKGKVGTLELLRPPLMRRIFVAAILAFVALNMYNFLMPIYGTQLRLSASKIGLVVGSLAMATVVVRGFAPALARRLGQWRLMILSLSATGAGLLLVPLFSDVTSLMALSIVLGLVLGVAAPVALVLMHEASPPEREGEVFGLRLSVLNGMQTAAPLLGGMGAAGGIRIVFAVVAVLILAGAWYIRDQWRVGSPSAASGRSRP